MKYYLWGAVYVAGELVRAEIDASAVVDSALNSREAGVITNLVSEDPTRISRKDLNDWTLQIRTDTNAQPIETATYTDVFASRSVWMLKSSRNPAADNGFVCWVDGTSVENMKLKRRGGFVRGYYDPPHTPGESVLQRLHQLCHPYRSGSGSYGVSIIRDNTDPQATISEPEMPNYGWAVWYGQSKHWAQISRPQILQKADSGKGEYSAPFIEADVDMLRKGNRELTKGALVKYEYGSPHFTETYWSNLLYFAKYFVNGEPLGYICWRVLPNDLEDSAFAS